MMNVRKVKVQILRDSDDAYEKYAKEEMTYFLERAGIEVVNDQVCHSIIYLGRTYELGISGIKVDREELGASGYVVKSLHGDLYICGGSSAGTLFGVYDFLSKAIGYKRYAEDEIAYNRVQSLSLDGYDYIGKPAFEYPWIATSKFIGKDRCHFNRIKNINPWLEFPMHNSFVLVPPATYKENHPDWFAVDEKGRDLHQLNYNTKDEGLLEVVFNGLKQVLIDSYKPENYDDRSIYLMFGIEDYEDWDRRPESVALYNKYGTDAASLIFFVNRLADKMKAWVEENQKGREVYLAFFAYQPTKKPPVRYDKNGRMKRDEKGNAVPVDEKVVLRDNVVVRLAPIEANWYVPFESKENEWVKDLFDGWAAIAKNITPYVYSNSFHSQYANLNNFDTLQPNYQFLSRYPVRHVYDQFLTFGYSQPCFSDYRLYLQSNLLWDLNISVEECTEDFFNAYYKSAKEPMLRYFKELKEHYKSTWKEAGLTGECNWVFLYKRDLWDKATLERWLSYMEEAYTLIQPHLQASQTNVYHKLFDRITMESCGLRFLYVTLYGQEEMDDAELFAYRKNLFEDLSRFGMHPRNAGYTLTDLRKEWKV